jgi:hypothetical protein
MITWEDENGKAIQTYEHYYFGRVFDMISLLPSDELNETKCLQFIEPWGDTTFNQTQIPILLKELESTLSYCPDEGKREHYEGAIEIIRNAEGKIHTYIKFWGD